MGPCTTAAMVARDVPVSRTLPSRGHQTWRNRRARTIWRTPSSGSAIIAIREDLGLDQRQTVAVGNRPQLVVVGRQPVEIDGDDRPRPVGDALETLAESIGLDRSR